MKKSLTGTDISQVSIMSLSHIRGQLQVVDNLQLHLRAYFNIRSTSGNTNSSFGPVALCGPSGTGKTIKVENLIAHGVSDWDATWARYS